MKEYSAPKISSSGGRQQGPRKKYYPPPRRRRPEKKNNNTAKVMIFVALACGLVILLQGDWITRNRDKFNSPFNNVTAMKARKAEHLEIQCGLCGGTGLDERRGNAMCPLCFGVGTHHCRKLDQTEVICAACLGAGKILDVSDSPMTCPHCGGRGLVPGKTTQGTGGQPIHILQIECDECTGSGVLSTGKGTTRVCPVCVGRGFNWARRFSESDVVCPACGGMGRILDHDTGEAHVCGRCHGRGLIESNK